MTAPVFPRPPFCPPGGCTARLAEQLGAAVDLAFASGRAYERAELAALEVQWQPLARKTWEQAVADRLADMAAGAERDRQHRASRPNARPLRHIYDRIDWPPVAVPGVPGFRLSSDQTAMGTAA